MTMNCPHCDKPLAAKVTAKLAKESEMSMVVTISDGHMLMAGTVGGLLTNTEKLLKAVAKNLGGKSDVFVKSISLVKTKLTLTFWITGEGPEAARGVTDLIRHVNATDSHEQTEHSGSGPIPSGLSSENES